MLSFAIIGRLIIAASGFLGAALLARVLGPEENGRLFYLLGVLSVSMTFGGLGLNNYLVSKINCGDEEEAKKIIRLVIFVVPVVSFVIAFVALFFSGLDLSLGGILFVSVLAALLSGQIVMGEVFRSMGRFGLFQLISNGNYVVSIPATGVLATLVNLLVLFFVFLTEVNFNLVYLLLFGGGVALIVFLFSINFLYRKTFSTKSHFSLMDLFRVFYDVRLFFVVSLLLSLFSFVDVFLLRYFLGDNPVVASYMMALRLVVLLHIPQIFLVSYFQSRIAKFYFDGAISNARDLCLKITRYIFPIAFLFFLTYCFVGVEIMRYAFGDAYAYGSVFLVIRGVGYLATIFFGVTGGALLAVGKAKEMVLVLSSSIILTIVCSIILVEQNYFSVPVSIAIAVSLGQIAQAMLQWNIARYRLFGKLDYLTSLKVMFKH